MKLSKTSLLSISAAMLVGINYDANASNMTIAEKLELMRVGNTPPKAVTTPVVQTPVIQQPAPVTTTPLQQSSTTNDLASMMERYGVNTTTTVVPPVVSQPETTPVVQTPVIQQPAPVTTTPQQSNTANDLASRMARYGVSTDTTVAPQVVTQPQPGVQINPTDLMSARQFYQNKVGTMYDAFDKNVHTFNGASGIAQLLPFILNSDNASNKTLTVQQVAANLVRDLVGNYTINASAASLYDIAENITGYYDNNDTANERFKGNKGDVTQLRAFIQTRVALFNQNIAGLNRHILGSPIENSELKVNMQELFSRTWSVIESELNNDEKTSKRKQLFVNICDNTRTGGGCYPGFSGRIAQLYVSFTNDILIDVNGNKIG